SVDGGGFRGLACLIILNQIMRRFVKDPDEDPIPPCQIFDLICGTSTGGIIAILLGRLGLDCRTAISIYKELGPKAFGHDAGKMWDNILAGERFSSTQFETFLGKVVKDHTGNESATLRVKKNSPDPKFHESTATFVTVVPAGVGSAGVEADRLRSYPTPDRGTDSTPLDHTWTIRQAARATSATPLYFAPLQLDSQAFQDAGASGFNNPTMEAKLLWPDAEFVVVSLGAGLASLLPKNSTSGADLSLGKALLAKEIQEKWKNITAAPHRLEQVAEQLMKAATDTELRHLDVANQFDRW
ncbi:acyl transferase/acyl hydrolase/lysophospholipase, partial [Hygrophoropsis aurantiaca]